MAPQNCATSPLRGKGSCSWLRKYVLTSFDHSSTTAPGERTREHVRVCSTEGELHPRPSLLSGQSQARQASCQAQMWIRGKSLLLRCQDWIQTPHCFSPPLLLPVALSLPQWSFPLQHFSLQPLLFPSLYFPDSHFQGGDFNPRGKQGTKSNGKGPRSSSVQCHGVLPAKAPVLPPLLLHTPSNLGSPRPDLTAG